MEERECIALILAGGKGNRLGALTDKIAKPAIYFGGRYRLIDFTLSNCLHSGIDVIGVLTQYQPFELHNHINGEVWGAKRDRSCIMSLPSYLTGKDYTGTADAVYQNTEFIEQFNPEYVLILSGDHVYKMDYEKMLYAHKKSGADATIAAIPVSWKDATRFGVMRIDENRFITDFEEKPKNPKSNLASMGIYIFKWSTLRKYLKLDHMIRNSVNDFGKNIIPDMLSSGAKISSYKFDGYWRDIGTIESLWRSNMDLIDASSRLDIQDENWKIYSTPQERPSSFISGDAMIKKSIIAQSCSVYGKVENSILFDSVHISEGTEIIDSIIMPNVYIGKNAKINKAIVGADVTIGGNVEIGAEYGINRFVDRNICSNDISVIAFGACINENVKLERNSHIDKNLLVHAWSGQTAASAKTADLGLTYPNKDLAHA